MVARSRVSAAQGSGAGLICPLVERAAQHPPGGVIALRLAGSTKGQGGKLAEILMGLAEEAPLGVARAALYGLVGA